MMKRLLLFLFITFQVFHYNAQGGCITHLSEVVNFGDGTCRIVNSFTWNHRAYNDYNITWDFGDGNSVGPLIGNYQEDHTYSTPGGYTVVMEAIHITSGWVYTCTLNVVQETVTPEIANFSVERGDDGIYSFVYNGTLLTTNTCWVYHLDFGDGSPIVVGSSEDLVEGLPFATHQYDAAGDYSPYLQICVCPDQTAKDFFHEKVANTCCYTYMVNVSVAPYECCLNFAPIPGKRYWVSAWVQESWVDEQPLTYDMVDIQIRFEGAGIPDMIFRPEGAIIDGWQRIAGDFVIPENTTDLTIHLMNHMGMLPAFFDDVRIHPWNSSMKSYVYDPETYRLVAELDDNNYATFYEYDNEGQLVRIKKETARGIMTIQESRSHSPIKTNE